ncbi:hypothetical protein HZS_1932 [Henneguya salminicola]|nr:hypothetical protein HZS_1932 [Henneguya salminicola]
MALERRHRWQNTARDYLGNRWGISNSELQQSYFHQHDVLNSATPMCPMSHCNEIRSANHLFVSCVYAVLTCKNEEMYGTVLREIVVLTKYHRMSVSITVDFEKCLLNACKHEFTERKII